MAPPTKQCAKCFQFFFAHFGGCPACALADEAVATSVDAATLVDAATSADAARKAELNKMTVAELKAACRTAGCPGSNSHARGDHGLPRHLSQSCELARRSDRQEGTSDRLPPRAGGAPQEDAEDDEDDTEARHTHEDD
eukprot:404291-Prymnesium_polylepis.2